MKKILSVCLILMIALPVAFSFVGCNYLNDFPDLSGYIANVTDATGVGISKLTKTSATGKNGGLFAAVGAKHDNKQLSADGDGKNYAMVGNDNGFEELSFTKIIADAAAELIQGETRVIASSNKDASVDIVSRTDNSITIAVDPMCEYRAVDMDGNVLVEWGKFETDTHTFDIAHARDVKVECRSLEAKISFNMLDGFEYTICHNGQPVMEGLHDNDDRDNSKRNGFAELGHFTEGESYEVRYKGHGKKDECSQDKLGADIDKLYTVNGFTFISFVAKGKSKRPSEAETVYCQDGVNAYDKIGYYSDKTRKSFVIDNATGYVYPLENFHVRFIMGGLLFSDENRLSDGIFVYDFKATDDGKLNIYQLFTNNKNKTINSCMKDKYGHKYIVGPFDDGYDSNTDTYYYKDGEVYATSEGTALLTQSYPNKSFKVSTSDGSLRNLSENDYLAVYDTIWLTPTSRYMVKNGIVFKVDNYEISGSSGIGGAADLYYGEEWAQELISYKSQKYMSQNSEFNWCRSALEAFAQSSDGEYQQLGVTLLDTGALSYTFFEKYNTVLAVTDGCLIRFKNVWEYVANNKFVYDENEQTPCDYDVIYDGKLTLEFDYESERYVLVEDSYNGKIKYEIAVDYTGNTVNFRLVEQSSYTRPPRTVTLQPINR